MKPPYVATLVVRYEVASTSDLARALVVAGETPLPFAVYARRQTSGRGRGANVWWSGEGSLSFTLVLDPARHGLRPAHEARLALAAAVGIVAAVESLGTVRKPLGIRWPNDVEAGGRKLAGILPERVETDAGPRVLVGVGVNVGTRLEEAPAEVRSMATSVASLLDGPAAATPPGALFVRLLERLPALFDRLAADDPTLAERWGSLDTLFDRPLRVKLADRFVEGVGRGIDPEGALLVAHAGGIDRLFGGQVLRSG
jgi:BirA family transcriptional regulator, biotin operon repressor / biotin---[acetyl-CoA-carboxylase] ligase